MTDADLLRVESVFKQWRRGAEPNGQPMMDRWVAEQTEFSQEDIEDWLMHVREHGAALKLAMDGFEITYKGLK